MKASRSITSLLVSFAFVGSADSPKADLASTNQVVRASAARILRATYTQPSSNIWTSLISSLKLGTPKSNVLESLQQRGFRAEGGGGSGSWEVHRSRLDEGWLLETHFRRELLSGCNLAHQMSDVQVDPPAGFTGQWTTYWINGHTNCVQSFTNGKRDGETAAFYDDGPKAYVTHFVAGIQEGEAAGYHRSGKLHYRGYYKAGEHAGVWTWFEEDGSIQLKRDYSKP